MRTIYRGYIIEQKQSNWVVFLDGQIVHVTTSEEKACDWIDACKREAFLQRNKSK